MLKLPVWELSFLVPFSSAGPGASSQQPGADLPKQIESTNGMAAKANLVSIARNSNDGFVPLESGQHQLRHPQ